MPRLIPSPRPRTTGTGSFSWAQALKNREQISALFALIFVALLSLRFLHATDRRPMDKPDKKVQRQHRRLPLGLHPPDVRFLIGATLCAAGVSAMSALFAPLLALFANVMTKRQALTTNAATIARAQHIPAALAGARPPPCTGSCPSATRS